MARNKTRRNKTAGGSSCGMKLSGGKNRRNKTVGGKTRKASNWNKAVMSVYGEMKKKNSSVSFSDALKEASKRKKAGKLY